MWLQSQSHVNCLHSQGANGWKLCCSLQSVGCKKKQLGKSAAPFQLKLFEPEKTFYKQTAYLQIHPPLHRMERYPELNYRNFLKHEAGWSRQRLPAIFSLRWGRSLFKTAWPLPMFFHVFSWNNVTVVGSFRQTQNYIEMSFSLD